MSLPGRVAGALLALTVLSGCTDTVPFTDVVGFWVAAPDVQPPAEPLALTVRYVPGEAGCWSADGPEGLLPVRWPVGTVAGLDQQLELPGGAVVGDGTAMSGTGGHRPAAAAEGTAPVGCDVADGFYAVATVDADG